MLTLWLQFRGPGFLQELGGASSGVYEEVLQLELRPLQFDAVNPASQTQASWTARVNRAINPSISKESILSELLGLSAQMAALSNFGLGSKLMSLAEQSPLLQSQPSAKQATALLKLQLQFLQPGSQENAASGLATLLYRDLLPDYHSTGKAGWETAIACIDLVAWTEAGGGAFTHSYDFSNAAVGDFAQLWQACNQTQQTQLGLLYKATQMAPKSALSWAALSNWLYHQLTDEILKVHCLPLFPSSAIHIESVSGTFSTALERVEGHFNVALLACIRIEKTPPLST